MLDIDILIYNKLDNMFHSHSHHSHCHENSSPSTSQRFNSSNQGQLPQTHPFRRKYTLQDAWDAAGKEDFDYVYWTHIALDIILENTFRAMGKILVIVAFVLIVGLTSLGLFYVVPRVTESYSFLYFFHTIIGKKQNKKKELLF